MAPVREREVASVEEREDRDDAFLRDVRELDRSPGLRSESEASLDVAVGVGLAHLTEALPPMTPPAAGRERLLAEIPATGRFARFAESTARLLDLDLPRAKALLDRIEDKGLFSLELPGIWFYWCAGGPSVANAVRGFIRVEAGTHFPEHEHVGDEIVLVLQGSYVDGATGRTIHVGETAVMAAGTSHAFFVPAGGPDLLKLSVTQAGLRALGQTYLPRE